MGIEKDSSHPGPRPFFLFSTLDLTENLFYNTFTQHGTVVLSHAVFFLVEVFNVRSSITSPRGISIPTSPPASARPSAGVSLTARVIRMVS